VSVIALLEIHLHPGSTGKALELLSRELDTTRGFAGCEDVQILVESGDPTRVLLVERWASPEADAAYREFRAAKVPRPLDPLFLTPPTIRYFHELGRELQ